MYPDDIDVRRAEPNASQVDARGFHAENSGNQEARHVGKSGRSLDDLLYKNVVSR
jgi:hypothetical protein